jgi:hypothetical protein
MIVRDRHFLGAAKHPEGHVLGSSNYRNGLLVLVVLVIFGILGAVLGGSPFERIIRRAVELLDHPRVQPNGASLYE